MNELRNIKGPPDRVDTLNQIRGRYPSISFDKNACEARNIINASE